jgi:hypothetical protein
MSSEVVKKRGRPKKVLSDPIEVEKPEILGKSTTRAKSTKVIAKPTKTKPNASAKPSANSKTAPKSASVPSTSPKPINATPTSAAKLEPPPETKMAFNPEPTEADRRSKILEELRKKGNGPFTKIGTVVPAKTNPHAANYSKPVTSSSSQPKSTPMATKTSNPINSIPQLTNTPPSQSPKPSAHTTSHNGTPKQQIPFKEMNAEIVSKISSAAGAKPGTSKGDMGSKYKSAARRVTATIVALPILLVTSWVLYERCE